jgi:hypothetical protein
VRLQEGIVVGGFSLSKNPAPSSWQWTIRIVLVQAPVCVWVTSPQESPIELKTANGNQGDEGQGVHRGILSAFLAFGLNQTFL